MTYKCNNNRLYINYIFNSNRHQMVTIEVLMINSNFVMSNFFIDKFVFIFYLIS